MGDLIWKDVIGYEGLYKVSNLGDILGIKNNNILKNKIQSNGKYYYVSLSKNGFVKNYRVHRIVAMAFIQNPKNKPQVNHKDCDIFNNNVDNLEWVTVSENCKHSYDNGRNKPPTFKGKFGKNHNRSKEIRMISKDGKEYTFGSMLEANRLFGFDNTSLSYANTRINKLNLDSYLFKRGKLTGWTLLK